MIPVVAVRLRRSHNYRDFAMHIFKAGAVAACALFAAASAYATDYKFSYTFNSGLVLSGAFSGSHVGDIVTAKALIGHVSVTGPGINAPIYIFTTALEHFNSVGQREAGGATFSYDGLDNNFILTSLPVGSPLSWDENFLVYGMGSRQYSATSIFARITGEPRFGLGMSGLSESATGSDIPAHWVLTVPEPETYALMLAGLGLLGAAARRRKAKQA